MRALASSMVAFVAALAAVAGCGGKVAVDLAAGGAGGTGGDATSSSASSSSSSSSSSSASSSSSSSSTSASSSSTGGPGCPTPFPGVMADCDQEGAVCPVPSACCSGNAVCQGGLWIFQGIPCGQVCSGPCGPDDFACELGALCVTYIGPITTYQCRGNPCFEGVGCGCVEFYCNEQGMKCNNIQDGYKVLCD